MMATPQPKPTTRANKEHHTRAAECCDKAAEQHRHAAKSCAIGDDKKAELHAKQAQDHCTKAHDHGKQAMAA
jgi:hypothetical protein